MKFFELQFGSDEMGFAPGAIDTDRVELRIEIVAPHAISTARLTADELCAVVDGMIADLERIKAEVRATS